MARDYLGSKPFRKTSEGHPTVEGDSMGWLDYPHGPKAMAGIQDSDHRPKPGHPAPIGGAPNQMPGKTLGGTKNASVPTLKGGY